jgi:hypothetical protein
MRIGITGLWIIFLSLLIAGESASAPLAPVLPDPAITPGDVLTTDASVICVSGYSKSVRNVSNTIKAAAYKNYGISTHEPGEYEVDHLISLELGGSNSITNLWPESYLTEPLNAHVKDKLENRLHAMVCSGDLPLAQAQRDIAENWVQAYEKYIGKLNGAESSATTTTVLLPPRPNRADGPHPESKATNDCPNETPIKISKRGVIHHPGDPNYDRTNAISCFASIDEAIKNGYRLPR